MCVHDGTGQAFHDITHEGFAAVFLSVIPFVIDQVVQEINGRALVFTCFCGFTFGRLALLLDLGYSISALGIRS